MDDKFLDLLFDHYFEHEKEEGLQKNPYRNKRKSETHPFEELAERIYKRDGRFNNKIFDGISQIIRLKERKIRSSSRAHIKAKAFIHKHKNNKKPLSVNVRCIGVNGLAIQCRGIKFALKETVTIEYFGDDHLQPFYATCKVRYISPHGTRTSMRIVGLEFIKIGRCMKTKIHQLLDEEQTAA